MKTSRHFILIGLLIAIAIIAILAGGKVPLPGNGMCVVAMCDTLVVGVGNYNEALYFRPLHNKAGTSFTAARKGAHGTSNGTLFVDGHAAGIHQSYWMNSGNTGLNNTAFNAHEPYQQGATGAVAQ